jgi:hypothetical protein
MCGKPKIKTINYFSLSRDKYLGAIFVFVYKINSENF